MKEAEKEISALCDGYVKKPVIKADLIAELARFLKYSVEETDHPDSDRPETGNENKAEFETYALAPESLEKIPELINLLKTSFIPRWEELNVLMIMDDLEQFNMDLDHAAREYGLQLIMDYCGNLHKNIKSFDITGIKNRMAEFPKIIEKIGQLGNQQESA